VSFGDLEVVFAGSLVPLIDKFSKSLRLGENMFFATAPELQRASGYQLLGSMSELPDLGAVVFALPCSHKYCSS
jgi:hypothetical protein